MLSGNQVFRRQSNRTSLTACCLWQDHWLSFTFEGAGLKIGSYAGSLDDRLDCACIPTDCGRCCLAKCGKDISLTLLSGFSSGFRSWSLKVNQHALGSQCLGDYILESWIVARLNTVGLKDWAKSWIVEHRVKQFLTTIVGSHISLSLLQNLSNSVGGCLAATESADRSTDSAAAQSTQSKGVDVLVHGIFASEVFACAETLNGCLE